MKILIPYMAASQSYTRKLFGHSSHYVLGTLLTTFAHFFTFPIFTRIFTVSEYGFLSLITVTISTVLASSKLGLTSASVRMYEECRKGTDIQSLRVYYSTFFIGAILTGTIIAFLYGSFTPSLAKVLSIPQLLPLFLVSALIVFFRTVNAVSLSFLRAAQKTKVFNVVNVVLTYTGSGLSIVLVLFFIKGLLGFYVGQLIIEAVAFFCMAVFLIRHEKISLPYFSPSLFQSALKFGLPLVGLEFLNHILTYGDRFLITLYCDAEQLGIYSVGYNLSSYVSNLLLVPLSFAVTPLLMQVWTKDGIGQTRNFLTNATRYVALFFFPIIAGFIGINKELLVLLASPKYIDSSSIIPFAVIGVGFFALSNLLNAGLIIYKRTDKILVYSFIAAFLNIILNMFLIPLYGIIGAAFATLISYFVFFVFVSVSSFRFLSFSVVYTKIIVYLLSSVVMMLLVSYVEIDNLLLRLVAKITLGVVSYSLLILSIDNDLRISTMNWMRTSR